MAYLRLWPINNKAALVSCTILVVLLTFDGLRTAAFEAGRISVGGWRVQILHGFGRRACARAHNFADAVVRQIEAVDAGDPDAGKAVATAVFAPGDRPPQTSALTAIDTPLAMYRHRTILCRTMWKLYPCHLERTRLWLWLLPHRRTIPLRCTTPRLSVDDHFNGRLVFWSMLFGVCSVVWTTAYFRFWRSYRERVFWTSTWLLVVLIVAGLTRAVSWRGCIRILRQPEVQIRYGFGQRACERAHTFAARIADQIEVLLACAPALPSSAPSYTEGSGPSF